MIENERACECGHSWEDHSDEGGYCLLCWCPIARNDGSPGGGARPVGQGGARHPQEHSPDGETMEP